MSDRIYAAIDLKSFYASVECVLRGLDPLTTNLVVADASRTEKTICLAVSPSLKAYGIPSRARLFEVVEKVRWINAKRKIKAPGHVLNGKSSDACLLRENSSLALDYIAAPPQMAKYIAYSAQIYHIYLNYIAPEDIHVYSIDEVFIDLTSYLKTYRCSARDLVSRMLRDVLASTGITAAAGIGTNLYLAKVAMDIEAKKIPVDKDGVRIAELDERSYREKLWMHRPLTDFWRIGGGYAGKLEKHGMYTMGDIARCSMGLPGQYHNEALLYRLFGINAELLIDHAWGWEPCTIADIKAYKPCASSLSSGQVLHCAYSADKAKLLIQEMADVLALDLVDKSLLTDQLVLHVGYDIDNLKDPVRRGAYSGEIKIDYYGRAVPKSAHGSISLPYSTSSSKLIMAAAAELYDRIVDPALLVRRLNITANHVISESEAEQSVIPEQLTLFTDYEKKDAQEAKERAMRMREKQMQRTMLHIKQKYGKNAIVKGMNYQDGATTLERNRQIGGHRA